MLTIVTAATDRSLLTIEELRSAAGVTDTSEDAALTALGGYISALIAAACNVEAAGTTPPTLRLETVRQTYRHTQSDTPTIVTLSRSPVVSVTSVTVNDTVLDAANYELDGQRLHRLSGNYIRRWEAGEVVADYSAGWATVPDDLKYAAIKFVQAERAIGGRDPYLKARTIPGVLEQQWWVDPNRSSSIPPDVYNILCLGGYTREWGWLS